jgi:hypothetical protein
MELSERRKLDARFLELKNLRKHYEQDWRDICDNILPWRQRWLLTDVNRPEKGSRSRIINSKPTKCLGRFASGMMAGITSPARRWFHLTTVDEQLTQIHEVKEYLRACEDVLWEVLAKSNFYLELASGSYLDLGLVGNAGLFLEEDPDEVLRFESLAIGEYFIDHNVNKRVDTIGREMPMTARQMAQKFGEAALSRQAQNALSQGNLSMYFPVAHLVSSNESWSPKALGPAGKRYSSFWWEIGTSNEFLRVGGYDEFPALVPRWNVRPGDVYGRGPGSDALGDCKALQHLEIQKAKLIDKTVDPPMKGAGINGRASLLPGDMTYFTSGQGGAFEPAINIPPQAHEAVREHIAEHVQRIEEVFFVDLWMAMLNDQRAQRPTATEVEATKQEVMLQLGPLLQNLNHDLLEPMVYRAMAILNRRGRLPMPPRALVEAQLSDASGQRNPMQVEFISILHQAQKMTGIVGLRELIGAVQMLVQVGKTQALDKINEDAVVAAVGDMLGVKPELIYSADEVEKARQVKMQQAQAQQQGQAMLAATQGAKNLSSVEPQKLQELASLISPAAAAQAGMVQ